MENNKSGKLDKFFAGKGFYIVLALCVAVIGVSAYSLASHSSPGTVDIDPGITLENTRPEPTDSGTAPETDGNPPQTVSSDDSDVVAAGTWSEDDVWEEPTAWIWPVIGDVERGYTMEALAYDVTMADWRTHDGVDIKADEGDAVKTAAAGRVKEVRYDDLMGVTVVIAHADGYETQYSSLQQEPPVEQGKEVKAGDIIGKVGSTAAAEGDVGPHLHFSVSKDGKVVNPSEYVK